jgi:hypothetical protein
VGTVGHLKPADLFAGLASEPAGSSARQLFAGLTTLGQDVAALLLTKTVASLVDLAPKIGCGSILQTLLSGLCSGLDKLQGFIDTLATAVQIAGFLPGWLAAVGDVLDGVSGLLPAEVPVEVSPPRLAELLDKLRLLSAELPTPAELAALKGSLAQSGAVLQSYETRLTTPRVQAASP